MVTSRRRNWGEKCSERNVENPVENVENLCNQRNREDLPASGSGKKSGQNGCQRNGRGLLLANRRGKEAAPLLQERRRALGRGGGSSCMGGVMAGVSQWPGRPGRRRRRPGPRRRKVRLAPLPPGGESCARSLAPPLQTRPASLGSGLAAACGGNQDRRFTMARAA